MAGCSPARSRGRCHSCQWLLPLREHCLHIAGMNVGAEERILIDTTGFLILLQYEAHTTGRQHRLSDGECLAGERSEALREHMRRGCLL